MNHIPRHFSAFRGQIVKLLDLKKSDNFLDLTLGDGGHTQEALEAGCKVVSVDVDEEAIKRAVSFVGKTPVIINPDIDDSIPVDFDWLAINSNFQNIGSLSEKFNLPKFDGVMVDLGPSQFQVLDPKRGFTFLEDSPLDMRLDSSLGVTAKDLLLVLNEGELSELFLLADETYAKPIAKAICIQRKIMPLTTTKELADLVFKVKRAKGKIHPATKVFMALRMAVNLERDVIKNTLPLIPNLLNKDGIVGVISFHSGEDKLVKDFIKDAEQKNILQAINQKPLTPSFDELKISKRTRSAKLRLAKKIN